MKSHTTDRFRKAFLELPPAIQRNARRVFRVWKKDPWYPILHFKRIHETKPIYSIRIGLGWRALGLMHGEVLIWFWIGSHSDYSNLIKQL